MTDKETEVERRVAVKRINETIRGPVAAVFRELVPAFAKMDGASFHERILDDSDALHGCVLLFRKHRERFAHVLIDEEGRLVNDDFIPLRCGRSIHDVVGMILRTHAKRHYRKTVDGDPDDEKTDAGRRYAAIRSYLIHDWQIPLVPHYAPLAAETVRDAGPIILDLATPEAIATKFGAPPKDPVKTKIQPTRVDEPFVPRASATVGKRTKPVESEERRGNSPQEDFWWDAIRDPKVMLVIGERSKAEEREIVAIMADVGDAVRSHVLAGLSLSTLQAVTLLVSLRDALGANAFRRTFGNPGNPSAVEAIAKRLRARRVGSATPLQAILAAAKASVL
jgi:hypothetical protein